MDIFGIGTGELLAIFFIAILVLGPERMVRVSRQLGRGIRQLRGYLAQINREVPPELNEVREAVTELRTAGDQLRSDLTQRLIEPAAGRPAAVTRPPQEPAADAVILPGPPPPTTPPEPAPSETAPDTPAAPPDPAPETGP
jgi:sec-independent protein translocase protein TatB